jgi:hypothetical protein
MSLKLHKDAQVSGSSERQLELQIEHLKHTVKSPHDLIEHVIKLYAAEFIKANDRIVELTKANDEMFKIKQKVQIVNRELIQRNNELSTANSDLRIRIEQLKLALEGAALDFSLHEAVRELLDLSHETNTEHAQPGRADGDARPSQTAQA